MSLVTDITGVILAGGRSSRFGSNKALAAFNGEILIERIVRVMTSVFAEVIVVTNTPDDLRFLGLPILRDVEPYEGPLGGIRSVFEKTGVLKIFVTACDMPRLNADVIQDILLRSGDACAAVPVHDRQQEYLMAVYSRTLLPDIQLYMNHGGRSLAGFLGHKDGVAWIPVEADPCVNINTREELERLHAH